MSLRQCEFFLRKCQNDLDNGFELYEGDGRVLFQLKINEELTPIYVYYVTVKIGDNYAKYTGQLLVDEDITVTELEKRLKKTNEKLKAKVV